VMEAAGLSSVFASSAAKANPKEPNAPQKTQRPNFQQVPRRKLGKTGVEIPCLALGCGFLNLLDNQTILRSALKWGVNYWDTAYEYMGGNSELGIGKLLSKNPELRKKLFIVTKASGAQSVEDVEECLQTSLKRMNTNYIDLYYGVHGLSHPDLLTDELSKWAEDAKKRKLIRFFGFSTDQNMAECLGRAAKLSFIDAVLTVYNFRLMQDPQLQTAVKECYDAGVGLVAMKVTGKTVLRDMRQKVGTQEDKQLVRPFIERGFTEEQANIKVVLEDKRFSSVCITMQNPAVLTSNVAVALDKTKLTKADMAAFTEYARATCRGYCAGCSRICSAAVPEVPYISDIMRYLMYYNSYGERDRAREFFAGIPSKTRSKLLRTDYNLAEARCPQHLPIGKLVTEAVSKLA